MNDPSRPAKHPEILTLALPRPSPKDFDPCPTPPRPKGKKSAPSIPGGYQEKPKLYLFANDTRATPAGPFATKEGSIFSHQARHSTSCSSENRTLSTKSSTDLVLFIPASTLNYRAFQILSARTPAFQHHQNLLMIAYRQVYYLPAFFG